jgi:serine/threonine-protein kinase HipA
VHQIIQVYHHQTPAGLIDLDPKLQTGRFEWLPAFADANPAFVQPFLTGHLKTGTNRFTSFDVHHALPAVFADYLPGHFARDLLKEALRKSSRLPESLTTPARLSLMGDRGYGSFRFEPAGYPELNPSEPVDLDRMVRYAALIYQKKGNEVSDRHLRELLRSGLFVRGKAPKIMLAVNDFTGEVLSGQSSIPDGFEAWIMKLDGVVDDSTNRLALEYDYYQKSIAYGIRSAPCRILRDGHWKHLMIKRFDRLEKDKVAFVSFKAFQETGDLSWEAVFRRMRQLRLPYPDMEELYKRLIFNIFISNKNYGADQICFIYTMHDGWRLAPAFNQKPSGQDAPFALSLNEKRRDISEADLLSFGKQLNIKKAKMLVQKCREIR